MVNRKGVLRGFAATACFLALGCNNAPQPVAPKVGPSLYLSVPVPPEVGPSFTLGGLVFKYRITSGDGSVGGFVVQTAPLNPDAPVAVNLPQSGPWLVAGELFLFANGAYQPVAIGAEIVNVQGTTPFLLPMGILNVNCYAVTLAELGSSSGFNDLFGFDNYFSQSSAVTTGGDVQCYLDPGSVLPPIPPSLKFASPGGFQAFAYLGNGDLVDFAFGPADAVFRLDTLSAKRASRGPLAVMETGDIYLVRLSPTHRVWVQVKDVSNTDPTFVELRFRTNHHGFPYLKFDVTAYGDVQCNQSGNSYY